MPRIADHTIGKAIYERIKDYDIVSRKVFLKGLSEDHRKKYDNYLNKLYQDKYKSNTENKEKAAERARNGMKNLREERTETEIKQQRKPWDEKYNEKRKMTKQQAASKIQAQFRKKQEAKSIVLSILDDIIDKAPNMKVVDGKVPGKLVKRRGRKFNNLFFLLFKNNKQ